MALCLLLASRQLKQSPRPDVKVFFGLEQLCSLLNIQSLLPHLEVAGLRFSSTPTLNWLNYCVVRNEKLTSMVDHIAQGRIANAVGYANNWR